MTIGTRVLEHLSSASVFRKGHIVYCVEAMPYWQSVTLPVSEAVGVLSDLPRDRVERSCLLSLRAVRDHPGVDAGSLDSGRLGYSPICDNFWIGYVDSSTELLYIVMPRSVEELERRSAGATLIMSSLRLVGAPNRLPDMSPVPADRHPLLTTPVAL